MKKNQQNTSTNTSKPSILSPKVAREAETHLIQSSKTMARLVIAHGPCQLVKRKFRPFQTLTSSIISQQLSAKAADSIKRRLKKMVPDLSPSGFLGTPVEGLREAGLSAAKSNYIIELATRVRDRRIDFEVLRHSPDEEVITDLTGIPGIGPWTAQMFLIFALKRPDVLAITDAGLQRAVRLLYGDTAALERIAQSWKPFRSVASWYLWRHLDFVDRRQ